MSVLKIEKLTMRFGGITAVNAVDLTVEPGQIFSVIGPNGAGKTTVFNAVTGIYEPTEGAVLFEDKPLVQPLHAATGRAGGRHRVADRRYVRAAGGEHRNAVEGRDPRQLRGQGPTVPAGARR